jgi:SAM-dependent methyltransferase
MCADAISHDDAAKELWNSAYILDLEKQPNLWGDPPVPFAETAAKLFLENSAFVVLDLPCGDGRNLPPLARSIPIVVASDISRNAMTIAQRAAEKVNINNNIVFIEADIFATGFPSNCVDGIFCWDMLGHLTEPQEAIRELFRICRVGGYIIANMWTMRDCQVQDPNIVRIGPKEYIDHFDFYCKFYDRGDIDSLLDSVGLTAESVDLVRWTEPPHADYRQYEHEHECWVFTIKKTESDLKTSADS